MLQNYWCLKESTIFQNMLGRCKYFLRFMSHDSDQSQGQKNKKKSLKIENTSHDFNRYLQTLVSKISKYSIFAKKKTFNLAQTC